jgi:hypothetical protein
MIEFHFFCDGTGNIFRLTKQEILNLLKWHTPIP